MTCISLPAKVTGEGARTAGWIASYSAKKKKKRKKKRLGVVSAFPSLSPCRVSPETMAHNWWDFSFLILKWSETGEQVPCSICFWRGATSVIAVVTKLVLGLKLQGGSHWDVMWWCFSWEVTGLSWTCLWKPQAWRELSLAPEISRSALQQAESFQCPRPLKQCTRLWAAGQSLHCCSAPSEIPILIRISAYNNLTDSYYRSNWMLMPPLLCLLTTLPSHRSCGSLLWWKQWVILLL